MSDLPVPDDAFRARIDPSRSEESKPADVRKEQAERARKRLAERGESSGRANPIVGDETYGTLREDNRVVMRHTIALNIDSFRASSDAASPRGQRSFPDLVAGAPPFFSIVIANYNGVRHLPVVLGALREQSFGDFEVILVDDASSDESVAYTEREHPEVRVLLNRTNAGFAASCNTGAAASRGRYIVLLNSDTEPDPEWLAALARTIVTHPNAAAVASKLLLFDRRTVLHAAGDTLGRDGLPRNRGVWETDNGQYDEQTAIFSACGGAAVWRRDVWQALGGFDEQFWMYLEDVDLSFRARLAGGEIVFAPHARVYHHLSATGGDVLASYYVGRNTLLMLAKNMPTALLLRNLPAILGAQLRISVDALRNLRGEAAQARLRGQLAGLRALPAVLAQRRAIQRARMVEDGELARMFDGAPRR
jgi:GT2 family glycosyltransferase